MGLEQIEQELNQLVENRARKLQAERAEHQREQMWRESVRRYNAEQGFFYRQQWVTHHRRLERVHADRSEQHKRAADKLAGG